MDFTGTQLGAMRTTGLDPDNPRVRMAWPNVLQLSPEERDTLMVLLLAEILTGQPSK